MKFHITPWAHQLEAIKMAQHERCFAFFFEQGCGKTCAVINSARVKFIQHQRVLRTLVLGPGIVIHNWKAEFKMHAPKVDQRLIVPLVGSGKKRVKTFEEHAFKKSETRNGKIFITNYESLNMQALFDLIWDWRPELLILDESHRCKDGKSKRTKKAIRLGDIADYCFLASGTPILSKTAWDIFYQFRIMDKGASFGKNFTNFKLKYFFDMNAGMPKDRHFPDWVMNPQMTPQFSRAMSKYSMRVEKKDCLDLPPLVRQTVKVKIEGQQLKHYNEMKDEYVTYLKSEACVANLALTKGLRLQQIISGFMTVEDVEGETRVAELKQNPKLDALKELLKDLTPGHKVLVWAVFKKDFELITAMMEKEGISYVEVHGGVPAKKKYENIDSFNNDDSVKVFLGHPASGGIGINLVVSNVSVFYSRDFRLESDLQAEARNHRGGSEVHDKITRIDIVAENTIDEHIMNTLGEKIAFSEKILRGMADEI